MVKWCVEMCKTDASAILIWGNMAARAVILNVTLTLLLFYNLALTLWWSRDVNKCAILYLMKYGG